MIGKTTNDALKLLGEENDASSMLVLLILDLASPTKISTNFVIFDISNVSKLLKGFSIC